MAVRARWALAGAAGCLVLLAATWFAFHIDIFRHADQSAYEGFVDLHRHGAVQAVTGPFVWLCSAHAYVIWAPFVVLIALLRRRPWTAFGVGAILLGANVTTQVLKPMLAEPRAAALLGGSSPLPAASWPSGHSTAAMAAVLCLVLASPARLRPLVAALGAAFASAVGYSVLAAGAHYPSDVFGGYLVATAWALVIMAALSAADRRWPSGASVDWISMRAALAPPAVVVIAAVSLVGLIVLSRPHDVLAYAEAHKQLDAVAAAIATLSVSLSTGVMLGLRR